MNLLTREWVIIATERAKRPTDYKNPSSFTRPVPPNYLNTCPFCDGNEHKTPDELLRVADDGKWKIRVVTNKYPALRNKGERKWWGDDGARSISGVGVHEIIIESPLHNAGMAFMDVKHIEAILAVYRERFIEAHKDPRVEHVTRFKNHGEGSGTSIVHPHSQLIGTPVVPIQFRDRVQSAMHFFDDTGKCLVCSILEKEKTEGRRVLLDTDHFMTFIPYAALSPFHTWIFPKRHTATFSDIRDDELRDMAMHLKTLLAKFYYGLDDPDYNFVIRSSGPGDAGYEYCHWYLAVIPRITKNAGFELGSGMFINASLPEESADFLKTVKIEQLNGE